MNRFAGVALALLRVFGGLLLFQPGALKMFGWYGGMPPGNTLTGLVLAAGIIEIVAGPLLMLGLWTRPVAFLASGEMAVAYFYGHFPHGFWPIQNHGEPAVLLCFIFLLFAAHGAGDWSVDAMLCKKRE